VDRIVSQTKLESSLKYENKIEYKINGMDALEINTKGSSQDVNCTFFYIQPFDTIYLCITSFGKTNYSDENKSLIYNIVKNAKIVKKDRKNINENDKQLFDKFKNEFNF
jgi:hypothetical protein